MAVHAQLYALYDPPHANFNQQCPHDDVNFEVGAVFGQGGLPQRDGNPTREHHVAYDTSRCEYGWREVPSCRLRAQTEGDITPLEIVKRWHRRRRT